MINYINDMIFYHIYPLGFCGAMYENDNHADPIMRLEQIDDQWIDHIKELGVNAIYFGPIFESTYHGYDTCDYLKIDRRLGDNNLFKSLVSKLHENDIKVIVDGVFNHVGRKFWAFEDVKKNRENSKYINWFNIDFNGKSSYGDEFYYEGWEGNYDLVKLNLNNEEIKKHLLDAAEFWINDFKIDGIRIDVAYCIDQNFLKELAYNCKQIKENFYLLGEMIHGDYNKVANKETLDSATNYECFKGLYSSHNDKNYFEIAYALNRQFGEGGIYKDIPLYNFADNHDVNRVASNIKNKRHLKNLYAMLFTMPGTPSVYYGSEWGIEGKRDESSDCELRSQIDISKVKENKEGIDLSNYISKLSNVRKECYPLRQGQYQEVVVRNEQFIYKRFINDKCVFITLNLGDYDFELEFDVNHSSRKLIDLLNDDEIFEVKNNKAKIKIPKFGARILECK